MTPPPDTVARINRAGPMASRGRSTIGEGRVWLCGMGLALGTAMVIFLLGLILVKGLEVFWPARIALVELREDGSASLQGSRTVAGEVVERRPKSTGEGEEWQLFVGNKDAYNISFLFVDATDIRETSYPEGLLVAERMEYGDAIFFPVALVLKDGTRIPAGSVAFDDQLAALVRDAAIRRAGIYHLEKNEIGVISRKISKHRLAIRKLEMNPSLSGEKRAAATAQIEAAIEGLQREYEELARHARELRDEQEADVLEYRLATGQERTQPIGDIVGYHYPNRLTLQGRLRAGLRHFWTFLSQDPRESNTEGGIFPAIFGTFVMTIIMSALVTPFGVIAAIYLREYARQGFLVRSVRISVNNLAGVPSIVFGVFGLGFFIYGLGSYIDGGPKHPIAPASWWLVSAGAIASCFGATLLSIRNAAGPGKPATSSFARGLNAALWLIAVALLLTAMARSPYFQGFYSARLPTPTFGTGGIFWASLTLALLTLPVVIVATEEALSAVPRGVREAALACGASKWQMIQRVVLPSATPGVLTGIILAMARGAGEVAPLMLVGVVKMAPSLPIDSVAPFIHPERKFMHLGFHIYDLGFQSPDSEAAKPMVFATTFLLIVLVVAMNLAAIQIRNHLRKKYASGVF